MLIKRRPFRLCQKITTGAGVALKYLSSTLETALTKAAHKTKKIPRMEEPRVSPVAVSLRAYEAMTMTMAKHTHIPTISTPITRSFRRQNATMEIQNGHVLKMIIRRERGARGTAVQKKMKDE